MQYTPASKQNTNNASLLPVSESLLSASYVSNSVRNDADETSMSLNESNAPRLNKSISPRVPSSINKVPNNDKHGFDMSIDIPVENHDNRHDLPFTPANIVSKHKSNSSHRTKWKDTRSSDGGDGRKVKTAWV